MYSVRAWVNMPENSSGSRLYRFAARRMKYSANTGISSLRWRNGGIESVNPFSR